ncbi:hypothetical protein ONZ43_g900 [Nemania bipapillata]|uniref:Uncharacterized protein n=1 Tax=Nemania bipapillata TaxID=110536 RepID=A0ACC2J6L9_9PEZI|nr:hypothetical protein ONZ43_g900 [Nemania bipapillata]
MELPMLPIFKLEGFDHIPQKPAFIDFQSTHTNAQNLVTAEDRAPATSAKDGAKKLSSRREPMAAVIMHTPGMRDTGAPKEQLSIAHSLIAPPPSAKLNASQTRRRKPTTRTKSTARKRNLRAKHTATDMAIMKTLPSEMRPFFEKETLWSNAQADSDYLLRLPQPNHKYLDAKNRLKLNDLRFTPPKIQNGGQSFISAGIPSEKPYTPHYAPYYEAASPPVQVVTLSSAADATFDETANNSSQEEAFHARPSVKLIIPDVIKALLVDDWENVTKNMQLVPLPHPKPVTKILEDYSTYEMPKRTAGSSHADILEETLSGLKEYFDKSLGRILLYKFERPQYAEVHKKWNSSDPEFQGKMASDIYGAEHLCRLIVSLPELIAQTNMDQQSVNRLREELAKFSTWLSKNAKDYFVSSYETPAQDYVDKAKN